MRIHHAVVPVLAALLAAPSTGVVDLAGQASPEEAYYRGLADHFGLPAVEVRVLSEWQIQPEEVPVALFMARHGGVSADALMALKRGGRSWNELASRYDLGAGTFHVPLPPDAPTGSLASAYERFRSTPSGEWDGLALSDAEIVQLVNVKVLSEYLRVPPARVLEARAGTGSFVEAFARLVRAGG